MLDRKLQPVALRPVETDEAAEASLKFRVNEGREAFYPFPLETRKATA